MLKNKAWSYSTYLEQKVSLVDAGHVGNPARIDVVHVLEAGTPRRRDHLHQGRRRLGPSQHEPEPALPLVQDCATRLGPRWDPVKRTHKKNAGRKKGVTTLLALRTHVEE